MHDYTNTKLGMLIMMMEMNDDDVNMMTSTTTMAAMIMIMIQLDTDEPLCDMIPFSNNAHKIHFISVFREFAL